MEYAIYNVAAIKIILRDLHKWGYIISLDWGGQIPELSLYDRIADKSPHRFFGSEARFFGWAGTRTPPLHGFYVCIYLLCIAILITNIIKMRENEMEKRLYLCIIPVFLTLLLIIGCASSGRVKEPDWIWKLPPRDDIIQSLGWSPPTKNPVLCRDYAANSARKELARILSVRVQNLIKTWSQEHQDYFTKDGSSINYYESVGRSITSATLVGSQIEEFWQHPKTEVMYARASISRIEAVKKLIEQANEVARRKKTLFVEGKVDDAMKELDKALKNMQPDYYYRRDNIEE